MAKILKTRISSISNVSHVLVRRGKFGHRNRNTQGHVKLRQRNRYQEEKFRKQSHYPSYQKKKKKNLGINLLKETKDLYSKTV